MKKSSLKNKVWLYLCMFSVINLTAILILQLISSNVYYEFNKKREIKKISDKIIETYKSGNYNSELNKLSYEKDICIEITNGSSIEYSTDSISRGCLGNNNREINDYKLKFMLSGNLDGLYKIYNQQSKNKTLIYGVKINNNSYVFISTSLGLIGYTSTIIKRQIILISIIVFIIGLLISYIISKNLSKPLEEINKKTKEISKGNYNITFNTNSNIDEISNLESTMDEMVCELSKTEELRRELLANVSHDLKTPLTIIKANAEMVEDITYKDKAKMEKNIGTITEEVDRLNLLVDDILNLSKMQSNQDKLNYEIFNLNELIRGIIKRFDILCEKDNYIIIYNGIDVNINADKKKLEQVVYNLINNSINYTGDDKKIYINLKKENNKIKVEFIDTGEGISKDDIKYIWDKYYKVDKKYKRVTYGTGLGLSIVKNILSLHNFEYGVKSKKGKGTKFYFTIKM